MSDDGTIVARSAAIDTELLDWAFQISDTMRTVGRMIDSVAATDVTVLVSGESGVGKELVARALRQRSTRSARSFVKVNCAALPAELLESELFGHDAGAFTGAYRDRPGKFEQANGGTIFLDEIGEMPLNLQAKLLQVVQDQEFSRLGSRRDTRVDVRIIAATNRDLRRLVEQGEFRSDLYYRLNVISIEVPPLRTRRSEIPILVDHFLTRYSRQYQKPRPAVTPDTMRLLETYQWPGNVRELENTVKAIVVLESDTWVRQSLVPETAAVILPAELVPQSVNGNGHAGQPVNGNGHTERPVTSALESGLTLRQIGQLAADEAEKAALRQVLERVRWDRGEAARRLQVSYKTLLSKIKQHGLGGLALFLTLQKLSDVVL